MTSPLTFLHRGMFVGVFVFASAPAVLANCSDLWSLRQDEVDKALGSVAEAQLGLRIALDDRSLGLSDGHLGPVTRDAMVKICKSVPQPGGSSRSTTTLDLIREFTLLGKALRRDGHRIFDMVLTDDPTGTRWLALTATPVITAHAIDGRPSAFDCAGISDALGPSPDARSAMKTLKRIFHTQSEAQICALFSAPADSADIRDSFARFGRLDKIHGNGIEIVLSSEFQSWVKEDRTPRLRRLLATESAVATLLDEYGPRNTLPDATAYSGGDCSPSGSELAASYFMLTDDDIASIKSPASIEETLQGFAKENPGFGTAEALWTDLRPVLRAEFGDCVLSLVKPLEKEAEFLSATFQLEPEAAMTLAADPLLIDVAPLLADFQNRSAREKEKLMEALKSRLMEHNDSVLNAVVENAAEAMAAAAGPTIPFLDAEMLDILPGNQSPPAPVPKLADTEADMAAAMGAIDNSKLIETLQELEFSPTATPDQIKSRVRSALAETVRAEVVRTTNEQLAALIPSVQANWTITDALTDAITALPYVQAAMKETSRHDLATLLESMTDVEYSSQKEFLNALQTITDANEEDQFSPFMIERLTSAATKIRPVAEKDVTLATEDDPKPQSVVPTHRDDLQRTDDSAGRFVAFPDGSGDGMWLADTQTGSVKFCFSQSNRSAVGEYTATCTVATLRE